ncbi:MAG: transglutaminase family protein, partial [Pseudomonadota bacterium]
MAIRIALHHKTSYQYDRLVSLSPHEVRLRPAPHARTPILSYSLTVLPKDHFINWQQDPYGNYIGRFVFPEKSDTLEFTVDLVADMTVINPFDFFVERYAEAFPFAYPAQLSTELGAYLQAEPAGPLLLAWLAEARTALLERPMATNDFLVAINQRLQGDIAYLLRMEPGVQTPEDTLDKRSGSCRDSAWLLVQILRGLGLAARFVSGYLIQLRADQAALDGPSGPAADFTDLHAWTEVYIPGAGWIGLDPTSGMLASEGHIPLACTAMPSSAAPVSGFTDKAEVTFRHEMSVTRIHEDPRVTMPYTDDDWHRIDRLGQQVDADLLAQDVRLTQGGEPTFVSIDDMDGAEWNTLAHGDNKRTLAGKLTQRLKQQFGPGGLLHYGQGKWYPGEPLPRWALNIFWRIDGQPMWQDASLFSDDHSEDGYGAGQAASFTAELLKSLGLPAGSAIAAYEDVLLHAQREQALPANLDPLQADLKAPEERRRLARLLARGLGQVAGYVLPLKAREHDPAVTLGSTWRTSAWPLRREHLYLIEGDSPIGLRLPLAALPWVLPEEREPEFEVDPFAPRPDLPAKKSDKRPILGLGASKTTAQAEPDAREVIHTALCVEVRAGRLHVFMPPLTRIEDYLALLAQVEASAARLKFKLRIEGYPPPRDPRIKLLSVTPDPGVIEVNIHPSATWPDLVHTVTTLYQEARLTRLGTEKFMLDGRHTGTGGGNHATLGGASAADSPMLRRPDLLKSLITYWQNHPALSYLFSGTFIGPTSQAPRVDEARDDNLYELAIAFQQMDQVLPTLQEGDKPWMVDRLLRNLLVDLTGNT